jgi:hypothetical protein
MGDAISISRQNGKSSSGEKDNLYELIIGGEIESNKDCLSLNTDDRVDTEFHRMNR